MKMRTSMAKNLCILLGSGCVALVDRKTHEVVSHTGTLAAGEMEFMGTGVIAQSATVSSVSGFVIIAR